MMIDVFGAGAVLLLIVGAFFGGMVTADRYNEKARKEEKYSLEVQYARLRANVDFFDPAGPYVYKGNGRAGGPPSDRNFPESAPVAPREVSKKSGLNPSQMRAFEERLNNTGSATVLLKNNPNKQK